MKILIDSNELRRVVSKVKNGIGDDKQIAVLGGIKIIATQQPEELKFITTNPLFAITCTTDCVHIEEEGELLVKGDIFANTVKKLNKDTDVEMQSDDDDKQLSLKIQGFSTKIMLLDTKGYPAITDEKPIGDVLKLNGASLKQALRQTLVCAGTDNTRPILKGINFRGTEGKLYVTGCDGFRFCRYNIECASTEEFDLTLTAEMANIIYNTICDEETVKFAKTESGKIIFECGNTTIYGFTYESEYAKLDNAIPRFIDTDAIDLNVVELSNKIDLAMLTAKDGNSNAIQITFPTNKSINLFARNSSAESKVELELDEPVDIPSDYKIVVNGSLLLQMLKSLTDETVTVRFSAWNRPITICGTDYIAVILPLRVIN